MENLKEMSTRILRSRKLKEDAIQDETMATNVLSRPIKRQIENVDTQTNEDSSKKAKSSNKKNNSTKKTNKESKKVPAEKSKNSKPLAEKSDLINQLQNECMKSCENVCTGKQSNKTISTFKNGTKIGLSSERTEFSCNFENRTSNFQPSVTISSILKKSVNFFHHLYRAECGINSVKKQKQVLTQPVVKLVSDFGLFRCATPFDRRSTALDWHPNRPDLLVVGSKGGDLILWDSGKVADDKFLIGDGAGGSIQAVKFWPWNPDLVCTSSINGTVKLQDLDGRQSQVLSDTLNCMDFWYCSLDVSLANKAVVSGDNVGNVLCLTEKGEKIWNKKLHRGKVTHVEFSPRESWLFCTGSIDHSVKLWDIRMVRDRKSHLVSLQHDKGVNSAYFSQTDGCRLLTTDQHSEIKIFSAPDWRCERTILHPHRFFQHITPIKATWHPLQDLIVIGRYPDPNFPGFQERERRTIDIFDANTGEIVVKLFDPNAGGIISLNKFNHAGDALASGMGLNILLWNRKQVITQKQETLKAKLLDLNMGSSSSNNQDRTIRKRTQEKKVEKSKTRTVKGDKLAKKK